MTSQREFPSQGSAGTGTAPAPQVPGQQAPTRQEPTQPSPAPERGYGSGYQGVDPRLAEPWRRFVGWLIDAVIIGVVSAAIFIPVGASLLSTRISDYSSLYGPNYNTSASYSALGTIIGISAGLAAGAMVLEILYYWLLTGLWGTTLGKRAVGTWVVRSASWRKVGMGFAFLRALIFVVGAAITALFFIVDNIWLLFDRQHQCLHDKAAGTLVVKSSAIGK